MSRFPLLCACLLPLSVSAVAAQVPTDRFDISIDAEAPDVRSAIVTLATTFAMLAPQTQGARKASRFEYRAGAGLVENAVATEKLQTWLPGELGPSVATLTAMQDTCDVSRHNFDNIDVIVAVHSTENARPEDAQRCFVAALWIYHAGGDGSVDVENWGVPYARILGSVASGRPAYAGAPAEED